MIRFTKYGLLYVYCKRLMSGRDDTRTVRGSDYSPALELSEQKDKLVTATGRLKNILKNKPTKSG